MYSQGDKGVDSLAELSRCLFLLRRRQESWSQAGNGHIQVGETKLGLKSVTGSHKQARERLSRVKTNNISQRHKQNELN